MRFTCELFSFGEEIRCESAKLGFHLIDFGKKTVESVTLIFFKKYI